MSGQSLLLALDTQLACPACKHEFSLEQGFARQALESIAAASLGSLSALKDQEREAAEKRAQQQEQELRRLLKEQGEAHTQAMADMRALTEQTFRPQLEALKQQLADSQIQLIAIDQREAALSVREQGIETRVQAAAAERAAELVRAERQAYEQRLADSQSQLKALRDEQMALREERQRLKDEKEALTLEVQKQVDAKLTERESQVRALEQERATLREAELHKTIEDMKGKLAEAQQKADQGSQQMQGEVLELAIEAGLRRAFPLDAIEEVKKGVRGGDVIQRVTTRSGLHAGTILWEAKRAKDWSAQWVSKLKEDMRACEAEVGVLVTMPSAVPKDWQNGQLLGLQDGVWITVWSQSFHVAELLRSTLLEVHKQRLVSAGKGEKMEAVYDYVTSPQFVQKLRAVYETFQKMRDDLESERNQATQRWARREKQLQAGASALLGIGGEIQGIAQQDIPALELQPAEHPRDA